MSFSRYIAFSIVASSVLCGATDYAHWNGGNFQDGDTVGISYDATNVNSKLLTGNINLTSGTLNATINAGGSFGSCGIVACLSGSTTFGSANSTINFTVNTSGQFSNNPATFDIKNGGSLTVNANIKVSGNIPTSIFRAQGSSSLAFNGDIELSGAATAITMGNGTLKINESGGQKINITGGISLGGGTTNIKLDSSDDQINGAITANGGNTTINLSGGGQINGNFTGSGTSNLTLTIDGSTYNGSITNAGTSTITIKNNGILQGSLTTSGTNLNLTMGGGSITGNVVSTATTNNITTNGGGTQNNLNQITLTGTNTLDLQNLITTSVITTSGTTTANIKQDSTISSMLNTGGTFTTTLQNNAIIQNGITTNGNTNTVNITLEDTSKLNGTSSLSSTNSATLTMKDTASGGDITLQGPSNTLTAEGTNNTLTGLTMQGANGGNATQNILKTTNKLTINGNATLKGKNDIDFTNGEITGVLSTTGETTLDTQGSTTIGQIHHSNGDFTANFKDTSKVDRGISTSGAGNANVTFEKSSALNGDSDFASTNNTFILKDSSTISGNTSFSNTSKLTATNGTTITGQIITKTGNATYEFGSNGTGTGSGATIIGGIDTETGAKKTIANFTNESILKDGTSNFHSSIDITFANTSKAIGETFNVAQGTANITFKDNAEMQGGSINNNGGEANIVFQDNSKMNNNGSINTTNGNTKLEAKNNADLTGTITQSGGTFNATFENDSKFNGDATQSGGTSDIKFSNQATWTGGFNQNGADSNSTITFSDTANMTGNIITTNGTTNITFNSDTQITGDIKAQGTENNVTFTSATLQGNLTLDGLGANIDGNSTATLTDSKVTGNIQGYDKVDITIDNTQVDGYLHQGGSYHTQGMKANITNSSVINGGFKGYDSSNNALTITNSTINNGVKQSTGTLKVTASEATITGGFEGSSDSSNDVNMLKGSLTGGITQNTGSLNFKSQGTDITGGFTGQNSINTLRMANGNFNNGKISQAQGSLQGEIIMMSGLGDFKGESSNNIMHLSGSEIQNIVQSAGSLEFNTNANVNGKITGDRGSINTITITGANVTGEISQNTGSMDLNLLNSNAKDQIKSNGANFGLYATNATVEGSISLTDSTSNGVSDGLTLKGSFTQSNGTSTMTFAHTTFEQTTTINNAQSASLIFTKSSIQDISATRGTTAFNLADSSMTSFTGSMGQHSITLVNSKATTFSQRGGSITLNASNNSSATSVAGTNFSNVAITLDRSKITGDVYNNGESTIMMQDASIGGKVEQIGTSLSFTASNSTLTGQYKQTDGTSMVNFINSKIQGGIDLLTLGNGTMNFTQDSQITGGVKAENSRFTFMLLSGSTLDGGFTQNQGQVTGTVDESTLNGGMTLSNSSTNFSFYNKSTLNGTIRATNHDTSILIDDSTISGDMIINGGTFNLTAQNNSTVNGNNGAGNNKSQVNITDADFKLILDTSSTFNGDITQTNNKQTIIVKQSSTLNGGITNTDVTSSISVNNATIAGDISQTRGSLALDLSNNGKVNGNITLTDSDTTLSGSGTGNQIGGNFTQNNGTLGGSMTGLTLTGAYSQTGGTSNVSFFNSEFQNTTTIKDATSSSLTFDHSTLKGYTTEGGTDNTLKLLNDTKMNGTLTLSNEAQTTLTMENSTLTGDNDTAITATGNSYLTFNTKDSAITGKIEINTGGLKGNTDNTNIAGDITLTSTDSNVSFTNTSTITGSLTATDGDNTINFDNSSITENVSQERGAINLDLSNGSGIGQNLTFTNATARLTGSGVGNSIGGNFDSNNTMLTGDASGLTLTGTFTQTNGSSDITFRNESNFNGAVSISGATSSNIKFTNQSGVNNTVSITNGNDNVISLSDNSFINGSMTLTTTTATISASSNSSITGDLQATNSNTNLSLSGSTFNGTTTQTNGTLNVNASNNSILTSNMMLSNGNTNITLNSGSNLTGTITANENPLVFNLSNNSSYNSLNTPQDISVTNADFTLTASNNSIFGGNLTHTSNNGTDHSANLTFNSNSFYSGTMDLNNVTVSVKFNQSGIFSDSVKITGKSALFEFDGSTNGGVIQSLEATNTNLTINAKNQSHITINDLQITGNTLNLTATNSSRLTANVTLNDTTKATYTANTNGNLNVNTKIANQASTLTVDINGGMMQGAITQNMGANGFITGEVKLSNGGRWAVTDDTQAKELALTNTEEQLYSDAIFASAFNSPLSFVDFTLDFADENTTSRVGKEMIVKPDPINGQPIPDVGDGKTYVRQLHVNEIKGNNGLFRVYADLGTNLADNILASKASGDHLIQVQYRAETFREIGEDRIVVAKVTDPNTTVSFKGTQSEIGLTKYNTEILKENAADGNGFEWIIGQATPAGMSYSSKIIASILQSQYRTFAIEIDSLDRRMGDLEFIKRDKGFWIRSFIGSNTKEATDFSTLATDNYYSIWSGFDYNSIGLTVHNYVGVFFNYTGINTESKDYTGKSSNIAFGFYNTFKAFSGFYADLLAKYIYTMSEFDISNYSLAKNSPKIDNHKFLLNAEIGYSFYYGEKGKSGYVQPQFQVTSGYIHKTNLSVVDVSGETINATIGRNFPVSIRAGAFWGQVFGEKIKSHIKLGTSFVYDVDSGGVLNFSDSSTQLQFKQGDDFRWVLSAASDFTFSEFFKLYASFDTSFFGNYNTTYSANLGIRFTFGRANNYVRNVPMVYSPYTPPLNINDDKRTVPVVKNYTTKDIDQNYVGKPRRIESYIQGNSNPNIQQDSQIYAPSRQSHRDITSGVEF